MAHDRPHRDGGGPRPDFAPHSDSAPQPQPAHRQWRYLALVGAGGAIGTGLRETATLLAAPSAEVPTTTFAINLSGAFLLGLLLQVLAAPGARDHTQRRVKLLLGTGVLGGFTTYSALAVTTAELAHDHLVWSSLLYALGSVVLGTGCSAVGIILGRFLTRRRKGKA